jgi:acetyltransferase
VRSDLKGRGLGHLLLDKLVRYQRAHGTERLVGEVLQENLAMRELARSLGFTVDARVAEGGALHHVLALQSADEPAR